MIIFIGYCKFILFILEIFILLFFNDFFDIKKLLIINFIKASMFFAIDLSLELYGLQLHGASKILLVTFQLLLIGLSICFSRWVKRSWSSVLWALWKARNVLIFKQERKDPREEVELGFSICHQAEPSGNILKNVNGGGGVRQD